MNNCFYFKKNMVHFVLNEMEENERKLFLKHISSCNECMNEFKKLNVLLKSLEIDKELSPSFNSYLNVKKKVFEKPKINENYIEKFIKWLKKPIPAYGVILIMIVLIGLKSGNPDLSKDNFDYSVFFSDSILTDTIKFIIKNDKILENNNSEVLNLKFSEKNNNIFEYKPVLKFETVTSDKEAYILKMLLKRYRELIRESKNKDEIYRFLKFDNLI